MMIPTVILFRAFARKCFRHMRKVWQSPFTTTTDDYNDTRIWIDVAPRYASHAKETPRSTYIVRDITINLLLYMSYSSCLADPNRVGGACPDLGLAEPGRN